MNNRIKFKVAQGIDSSEANVKIIILPDNFKMTIQDPDYKGRKPIKVTLEYILNKISNSSKGRYFENYVDKLLLNNLNFKNAHVTRYNGEPDARSLKKHKRENKNVDFQKFLDEFDFGTDIIGYFYGDKCSFQCKDYNSRTTPYKDIQETYLGGKLHKAKYNTLVSTTKFSDECKFAAKLTHIKLWRIMPKKEYENEDFTKSGIEINNSQNLI